MRTTVELHDTNEHAAQAAHPNPKLLTFRRRDGIQHSKGAQSVFQGATPHRDPPRGARTSALHLSDRLARHIERITAQLKTDYATELQHPVLAADAGKLFARLLRPSRKRGRPRSPLITAAIELANQGVPLAQIAWRVIPDFGNLRPLEQSYHRHQLRRAMHMRRSTGHKLTRDL
jgi:hypothetical protein